MIHLLKQTYKYDKPIIFYSAILVIIGILLPYTEILLPKLIIQLLLKDISLKEITVSMCFFVIVLVSIYFVNNFAQQQRSWRLSYLQQKSSHDLLMTSLFCRYDFIENGNTQAIFNRLLRMNNSNENNCYIISLYAITDIFIGLIGFFVYLIILNNIHPIIVLIISIFSLLHFTIIYKARIYEHKTKKQSATVDKKISYLLNIMSDPKYGKDIRSYNASQYLITKFDTLNRQRKHFDITNQRLLCLGRISCSAIAILRDGGAYLLLIYMALSEKVTIENFVLSMGAVRGISAFLLMTLNGFSDYNNASIHRKDTKKFLENRNNENVGTKGVLSQTPQNQSIEFRDVSFSYDKNKKILDNFSLKIAAGSKIAVVGVNGVGKSTLINLLCGFYKPDGGEILIGERDISTMSQPELTKYIACVFQECFIFPTTIRENIAPQNATDDIGIEKCLKKANLFEIIEKLGKSIDSLLTHIVSEEGIEFSGGQKQKLYLARLLYKEASIVILDEPTAALDPVAESKIYEEYAKLAEGKTAIFISHRLASARFCDYIILINNGKIEEKGSHEELIRLKGRYFELFQVQSKNYK